MKFPLRRTRALVVALAVATTLGTVTAAEAAQPEQSTSAGRLGQYLYYNADHFSQTFDGQSFADYGLTVDGILAMDSAHVGQNEAVRATDYVAAHIHEYTGTGAGSDPEQYAGATAKALLLAEAQHVTPAYHLGGVNLLAQLERLEAPNGRFSDISDFGDFSNTFGQSFAVIALSRAGQTLSKESISYLYRQQCPNGGFRIQLGDSTCTTSSDADTDATSMAMQGMLALPSSTTRTSRLSQAFLYLKSQMGSDGGVRGGSPTNTPNANSTGLAVASMKATDHPTYAAKGTSYLTGQRFGCRFPAPMRGLVAYDATRRSQAQAAGANAKLNDQDLRTTAQAVLGLDGVPYVSITKTGASPASPIFAC
jgi:hypothetical protein